MSQLITRTETIEKAARLVRQGALEEALQAYEKLLAQDRDDWAVANALGDLYLQMGRTDDGVDHFMALAEQVARDGHTAKARAIYRKILRAQPRNEIAKLRVVELENQHLSETSPFMQRMLETARSSRAGAQQQASSDLDVAPAPPAIAVSQSVPPATIAAGRAVEPQSAAAVEPPAHAVQPALPPVAVPPVELLPPVSARRVEPATQPVAPIEPVRPAAATGSVEPARAEAARAPDPIPSAEPIRPPEPVRPVPPVRVMEPPEPDEPAPAIELMPIQPVRLAPPIGADQPAAPPDVMPALKQMSTLPAEDTAAIAIDRDFSHKDAGVLEIDTDGDAEDWSAIDLEDERLRPAAELDLLVAAVRQHESHAPFDAASVVGEDVSDDAREYVSVDPTAGVTDELTEGFTQELTEELTEGLTEETTQELAEELPEDLTESVAEETVFHSDVPLDPLSADWIDGALRAAMLAFPEESSEPDSTRENDGIRAYRETEKRAREAAAAGKFQLATSMLEKYANDWPHHVHALEALIDIAVDGQLPQLPSMQVRLAKACLASGRFRQARSIAVDLVFRYPEDPQCRDLLDHVYERALPDSMRGSASESAGNVVNLTEVDPDDASLSIDGSTMIEPDSMTEPVATRTSEADGLVSAARSGDSGSVVPSDDGVAEEALAAADALIAAGDSAAAVGLLEEAATTPHLRHTAAARLARIFRQTGDFMKALERLEWAAEQPPVDEENGYEMAYELALTLEAMGEGQQALGVYRELLSEVGPTFRDVAARERRLTAA
jgi:tetratricopeptide (TPR) repeat protein